MDIREILSKVDHTLLKVDAPWGDYVSLFDDAVKYGTASVCIPGCYVKAAKEYLKDRMKVCTVVGFPNGYSTTQSKAFETAEAIKDGADEIDMVINIGMLKDKQYDYVENEIKLLKSICGEKILKVIIETCLLTTEEKIKMCEIVTSAGADYIKTSTGFSTNGATPEDVKIFAQYVGKDVKIKAAGGIKTIEDAEEFIRLGASRLGTSRIVKIVKEQSLI